jgi:energy-coupling factor transport system permease protein
VKVRLTYQPGESIFHRLHPLVKASWLLFGTVFVFVVQNPWVLLGGLVLIGLAFLAARLRLRRLFGVRLFLTTAFLLAGLQMIFNHEGGLLFEWGPLRLTTGGVEVGIYVAARFLCVVFLSYLFVLTTSPNDLAYAFMQAGLPYRYGFALITALRLVPLFQQEAAIVYQAQLARGVQYDRRNLRRLVILARQYILPMLVSALRKVDSLAVSMEGRCFGAYQQRTYLRTISVHWEDYLALVGLVLAIVLTIGVKLA